MIELLDGPAAAKLALGRAPIFLRAVIDERGKIDALDQLHDAPRPTERVHIYQLVPGTGFNFRDDIIICPPMAMASGRYRHRPEVDGEQLRDFEAWRDWCRAQPVAEYRGAYSPVPPAPRP